MLLLVILSFPLATALSGFGTRRHVASALAEVLPPRLQMSPERGAISPPAPAQEPAQQASEAPAPQLVLGRSPPGALMAPLTPGQAAAMRPALLAELQQLQQLEQREQLLRQDQLQRLQELEFQRLNGMLSDKQRKTWNHPVVVFFVCLLFALLVMVVAWPIVGDANVTILCVIREGRRFRVVNGNLNIRVRKVADAAVSGELVDGSIFWGFGDGDNWVKLALLRGPGFVRMGEFGRLFVEDVGPVCPTFAIVLLGLLMFVGCGFGVLWYHGLVQPIWRPLVVAFYAMTVAVWLVGLMLMTAAKRMLVENQIPRVPTGADHDAKRRIWHDSGYQGTLLPAPSGPAFADYSGTAGPTDTKSLRSMQESHPPAHPSGGVYVTEPVTAPGSPVITHTASHADDAYATHHVSDNSTAHVKKPPERRRCC